MSSVQSAAGSTASGCSAASSSIYDIPTQDISCALSELYPRSSNYSTIMSKCCKSASVISYAGDCALYCLAQGQSAGDLQSCFQTEGASPGDVFCRGNMTQTATATSGSKATGSATGASASSTSHKGEAGRVVQQSVSKAGLGVLAMLFVSAAAGALL